MYFHVLNEGGTRKIKMYFHVLYGMSEEHIWRCRKKQRQILPVPNHFGLHSIYVKENTKIPLMK